MYSEKELDENRKKKGLSSLKNERRFAIMGMIFFCGIWVAVVIWKKFFMG